MKVLVVLTAVLVVALAQNYDESPKPYSFNYVSEGEEGSSSHTETADGSGSVRGTYSLTDMDGRTRVVEYTAGPEGYNAVVRTNEPGTYSANPADVVFESSADSTAHLMSAGQTRPAQARPVMSSGAGVATRSNTVSRVSTVTSGAATGGAAGQGGSGRFVLVPADDPRARAYYGQS